MITYLDTSVILPALDGNHVLHDLTTEVIGQARQSGDAVTCATHAFAELYNHLTKPGKGRPNFPLSVANTMLTESLPKLITIQTLDWSDYQAAIRRCVRLQLSGPIIYDALHYQAALRAGATVIVTDNVRDFARLVEEEERMEIRPMRG